MVARLLLELVQDRRQLPMTDIKQPVSMERGRDSTPVGSSAFRWDEAAKTVFDHYFDQDGVGRVTVQHQLDNFNFAIETVIPGIIEHHNPVQIYGEREKDGAFVLLCEVFFRNIYVCKPLQKDDQEPIKDLYPSEARTRNLTYAAPMFMDVERRIYDPTGTDPTPSIKLEQRIPLCNFPIMLHSRYCHLADKDAQALKEMGESMFDVGGYFIINGSEKVIIPQERPCDNKIQCYQGKVDKGGDTVEVKSSADQMYNPISSVRVRLSQEASGERLLVVRTKFLSAEVNLFVIFRALGVTTDRKIVRMILGDEGEADEKLVKLLLPTALEVLTERRDSDDIATGTASAGGGAVGGAVGVGGTGVGASVGGSGAKKKVETVNVTIVTQTDALNYLANLMNIHTELAIKQLPRTLKPEEREAALRTHRLKYAREMLARDFLPHIGRNFQDKAMYLAMMVRRLLDCATGRRQWDDRDHYSNKRLNLPGILLVQLFRENFAKLTKDLKKGLNLLINKNQSHLNSVDNCIRRIIQTCKIESSLKYALSTGDWSSSKAGVKPSSTTLGIAQVLQRLSYKGTISHLRRIQSPLEKEGGKLVPPRRLHGSQIGYIDPNETPEGAQVGVVKNMSLVCRISTDSSSAVVLYALEELGIVPLKRLDPALLNFTVKVLVNGRWVGNARDSAHAVIIFNAMRYYKRTRNPEAGVSWNYEYREISIRTDGGRYLRPLYVVSHDPATHRNRLNIAEVWGDIATMDWRTLVHNERGLIEYLDCEESENALIATHPEQLNAYLKSGADTFLRYTHCEIHPIQWFGVLSLDIPFSDHNQSPRNCYQSSMGKQSVGVYVTNFNQRLDTAGSHILCYPQRPLVSPWANKYFQLDKMPHGQQAIVAIACFTGYNQEDSVILNESAIQRGLYNSLYFKTFVSKENKRKSSTSEIEQFGIPNFQRTRDLKMGGRRMKGTGRGQTRGRGDYAYRYLETDEKSPSWGLVRVGTKFEGLAHDEEVVLMGKFVRTRAEHKAALARGAREEAASRSAARRGVGAGAGDVAPSEAQPGRGEVDEEQLLAQEDKQYRDISVVNRPVPGAVIDRVIPSPQFSKRTDGDGNFFAKVREVCYRQPEIGDKFASRSAQKGTTGMKYRQEDMPFTARGLVPNLIMNPHAIPSRMTIAQLLETVIAKTAVKTGRYVDCTAFMDLAPTDLPEFREGEDPMAYYKTVLKMYGFDEHGEEVMYNPQTGEQFRSTIFIGPTYYQRLKHMVQDKIHARANGPVKTTTRQPSDGRSRDGGFRLGEMERDCLISHGVSQFLKERLMDSADLFRLFVHRQEHNVVVGNPDKGVFKYGTQDLQPEDVVEVQMPYAMNLFRTELGAMGIDVQLVPE